MHVNNDIIVLCFLFLFTSTSAPNQINEKKIKLQNGLDLHLVASINSQLNCITGLNPKPLEY